MGVLAGNEQLPPIRHGHGTVDSTPGASQLGRVRPRVMPVIDVQGDRVEIVIFAATVEDAVVNQPRAIKSSARSEGGPFTALTGWANRSKTPFASANPRVVLRVHERRRTAAAECDTRLIPPGLSQHDDLRAGDGRERALRFLSLSCWPNLNFKTPSERFRGSSAAAVPAASAAPAPTGSSEAPPAA